MKKNYLAVLAFLAVFLMLSVGAHAEGKQLAGDPVGGGFTGPGPAVATVQEAAKRPDDARVILEGYIVRSLGGDLYEFNDDTGTITVEISDYLWKGQVVSPKSKVRLEGEVERDWPKGLKIDVERLTML